MRHAPAARVVSGLAAAPLIAFLATWGASGAPADDGGPAVVEVRAERHHAPGGDQVEIALTLRNDGTTAESVPVHEVRLTSDRQGPIAPFSTSTGEITVPAEGISEELLRFAAPPVAQRVLLSVPGSSPCPLDLPGPGAGATAVIPPPDPVQHDHGGHDHGH